MARMTDPAPTAFEQRVLAACLAGDHPVLEILRRQALGVAVVRRNHSGWGACVDFAVDDAAPRLEKGVYIIDDVDVQVPGVSHGVATLLYVYDGRLQFLEFATCDDSWPEDPLPERIGYLLARPLGEGVVAFDPVDARDADTLARVLTPRHTEG